MKDRYLSIKFRNKNALRVGVSRDVYTQFYKDVFPLYSLDILENILLSFSEKDSEVFGRIITHCFIQYNVFPIEIEIGRTIFEQLLINEVRHSILLESFKSFIKKSERQSLHYQRKHYQRKQQTISWKCSRIVILIRFPQLPT